MVVYVGFLAAGSAIGPVVAGAVAEDLGNWRWFPRITAIAVFVNLIGSIFMLPETTHEAIGLTGPDIVVEDDSVSKAEEATVEYAQSPEQSPVTLPQIANQDLRTEWTTRSFSSCYVELNWQNALFYTIHPIKLIVSPQVLVTVLVFGFTIGWSVITSILAANIYAQPPLLWDSLHVGLLSFAPLTGLLIGLPIGGAFADFLSNRAQKSSRGHDPRVRLPAVLLGACVSPAVCLVLGYGLRPPRHWIILCVGWAMLSMGLTGSANVLLTYAVDCLGPQAGYIGPLVNLTKNSLAFGVSYSSVRWMQAMGPVNEFAIMAVYYGSLTYLSLHSGSYAIK